MTNSNHGGGFNHGGGCNLGGGFNRCRFIFHSSVPQHKFVVIFERAVAFRPLKRKGGPGPHAQATRLTSADHIKILCLLRHIGLSVSSSSTQRLLPGPIEAIYGWSGKKLGREG
jgi:hypothetical protein